MAVTVTDYTTGAFRDKQNTRFDGRIIPSCPRCGRQGAFLIKRPLPTLPPEATVTHTVTVYTGSDSRSPVRAPMRVLTDYCSVDVPDGYGSSAKGENS